MVLVNQIPPHKQGRNITSVESRLHMLELATEAEEHFSICLEELRKEVHLIRMTLCYN